MRKLLGRIIPAESVSIKESGRDWSEYVRGLADGAVERGGESATQEDLDSLRRHLVEFGAAQSRRLAVRQNLSSVPRDAPPRGSVAAIGSSVRFEDEEEEDRTFGLSPMAKEFWPRGKPTVCRVQSGVKPFKCLKCPADPTTVKMSWCPNCGNYRPDTWVCSSCHMARMGIDDYCRFRISGGCPGVRERGRAAVDDKHGPDALRITPMKDACKAAGAKRPKRKV